MLRETKDVKRETQMQSGTSAVDTLGLGVL